MTLSVETIDELVSLWREHSIRQAFKIKPRKSDVKNPITPAPGIRKPIPDFMSLAILKLL